MHKIFNNRKGSRNMQCCYYSELQRGLRARRQCLLDKDSVGEDPSENKDCSHHSCSTALINVLEWASESVVNPMLSNLVTISSEWDLISRMGEYGQASLIPVAVFSLLVAQERRSEPTQVVRPLWAFVRGWSNLCQISNFSNWRQKRLQVSRPNGTPLKTSSMLEGDVPQEQMTKHIKICCLFSFCKEGVRELRDLVGMAKTKSNTI